jgi:hypothetical protein
MLDVSLLACDKVFDALYLKMYLKMTCDVLSLIVIGSYFAYLFAKVAQSSITVDVIGGAAAAASAAAAAFDRDDDDVRPQSDDGWAWTGAQRIAA